MKCSCLTAACCWIFSTVAGALSCHQPESPASFLAESRADLMANNTLIDMSMPGSPVAVKASHELIIITNTNNL